MISYFTRYDVTVFSGMPLKRYVKIKDIQLVKFLPRIWRYKDKLLRACKYFNTMLQHLYWFYIMLKCFFCYLDNGCSLQKTYYNSIIYVSQPTKQMQSYNFVLFEELQHCTYMCLSISNKIRIFKAFDFDLTNCLKIVYAFLLAIYCKITIIFVKKQQLLHMIDYMFYVITQQVIIRWCYIDDMKPIKKCKQKLLIQYT